MHNTHAHAHLFLITLYVILLVWFYILNFKKAEPIGFEFALLMKIKNICIIVILTLISPTVWFEGSAFVLCLSPNCFPEGGFPLTSQTATLALLTDSFKIVKKHKIGIMIKPFQSLSNCLTLDMGKHFFS